ncbi:MAG TPA: glutathione S-transferase family protein [Dokdonella sp.]|uniref:glutathione S-transferase family protein n=1 Tax=Dokdonella sp. TaxID=2291710 RepID=UPI002C035DC4|nr:glutathione S-transferase family protein [Dokdonella sp.]HOX70984.1 glutathione S-transferase family protein [Dokdonella sp.]HPG95636.1 glutathione S-transferase family protein [Dokdonella sp.]HPN79183.1 glutathione S-transferase family protein [Dokdonella sp.]
MNLSLYAHPFSSYCQKVLIALYENETVFEYRNLDGADNPAMRELETRWPLKRFPILVENNRTVIETSIIIEYLQIHHPGPVRLIPRDPDAALEARTLDRFFDNYVSGPLQTIVGNQLRPPALRDPHGTDQARQLFDRAYAWLENTMQDRRWACGDSFTLADCAAAPSLFYADWTHPISDAHPALLAYRQRLLARPSFARAVEEARPYRSYFPLGAPDRD